MDPLAVDPLGKVTLDGLQKFTYISSFLSNEEREQLRLMLLNNIDAFAWSQSYMIRINPMVACQNEAYYPCSQISKKKNEAFPPKLPLDHSDGGRQIAKGRFYQGSKVPRMAS